MRVIARYYELPGDPHFKDAMAKCVELVLSGIKYRLFRAAVTVTIISLAVAFLMTISNASSRS